MAIVKQQPMGGLLARLGLLTGRAQRGKAEVERAQKRADTARMMALETEQRKKMMQFEQELKMKTAQVAHEWELQKMMLRSQNDFLMEEEKRKTWQMKELKDQMEQHDKYMAAVHSIMEGIGITVAERDVPELLQRAQMKYLGYLNVMPRLETLEAKSKAAMREKLLGIQPQGAGQALTADVARQFLQQAGGDKVLARQMARNAGYSF